MNNLIKALSNEAFANGIRGLSIVVDDAIDFPIVISVVDENLASCFLKYEVSDDLPGRRSGSENFTDFLEAVECAKKFQQDFNREKEKEWHNPLVEDDSEEEYLIKYHCPRCGNEWQEVYSCACDSECDNCGLRDIEAYDFQKI